ncbi:MAG: hypothetical protein AB7U95_03315 [Reyranella sp.]
MAKLPQLVSAIADNDERPKEALEWIARVIREGGELPTTKRGSGASDMSFVEAAKLLIGASVAEAQPKAAASMVPRYWSLIGQNYSPNPIESGVLAKVDAAPNFGSALAALIEGSLEVTQMFMNYVINGNFAALRITFGRPTPYATIKIAVYPGGEERIQFEWKYRMDVQQMQGGFYTYNEGDAASTRTIGLKTLLALYRAIAIDPAE